MPGNGSDSISICAGSSRRAYSVPESGPPDPQRIELQRARKLVTAAEALRGFPFAGLPDAAGNGHMALSRHALEDHLQRCEAAQLAAFEQALTVAAARACAAFDAQEGWLDSVRAGLLGLLEFFDEEPKLARFLMVYSAQAGRAVEIRRTEVLDRLARVLDDERAPARGYPRPLTAQAVLSGARGVLCGRLSQPHPGPLVELAGPLMSFIVLPFLGAKAARAELRRALDATSAAAQTMPLALLQESGDGPHHRRTVLVLKVLAAESGLNNREVAHRAGVTDQAHMSRILMRMRQLGLIRNTRDSTSAAHTNAWQLTASGAQLESAIKQQASVAVDVPEEFGGRMDRRAVSVLRVIGDQPWLTSREIAQRAGFEDPIRVTKLLAHLAGRGLVASVRGARFRGTPSVWRLTPSGEKLDRAIGREAPATPRSLVLDLMWRSGGRLSDDATSVLRVAAAEPGLSNKEISLRVGISDQSGMSQMLARLAERGLMQNTRAGGRYNVWQLTAAGEVLESAIRQETPAPVARRIALDLLKNRGGRLNHRAVWALRAIGAEPGLSNDEIALRVGIKGRGTTSTLLARLARFGLIKNTRTGGRENAWRLTATGKELEAAVRHGSPHAVP